MTDNHFHIETYIWNDWRKPEYVTREKIQLWHFKSQGLFFFYKWNIYINKSFTKRSITYIKKIDEFENGEFSLHADIKNVKILEKKHTNP